MSKNIIFFIALIISIAGFLTYKQRQHNANILQISQKRPAQIISSQKSHKAKADIELMVFCNTEKTKRLCDEFAENNDFQLTNNEGFHISDETLFFSIQEYRLSDYFSKKTKRRLSFELQSLDFIFKDKFFEKILNSNFNIGKFNISGQDEQGKIIQSYTIDFDRLTDMTTQEITSAINLAASFGNKSLYKKKIKPLISYP